MGFEVSGWDEDGNIAEDSVELKLDEDTVTNNNMLKRVVYLEKYIRIELTHLIFPIEVG